MSKTLMKFIGLLAVVASMTSPVIAQEFVDGDVFVSIGNGSVQWRHGDGTLVKTLTATGLSGFTTGMVFDNSGNLYVTMFSESTVAVFDNSGNFTGTFGSGYNSAPESIVRDRDGNIYVGQADGSRDILKFSPAGTLVSSFNVATDDRGSDWIELAADQCTMYYTSEGNDILRYDVCTNSQLANFATVTGPAFALRVIPSGGLLVATFNSILRLDESGTVVQTYDAPGQDGWFALNLDPDGTSFWSADLLTGDVYKFNIASGDVLTHFTVTGTGFTVGGLTVKGEITAALQLPEAPDTELPVTLPAQHTECITRDWRYWATHLYSEEATNCATLVNAIMAMPNQRLAIGFMGLPQEYRNGDNVKDAIDGAIEALGFYYRSVVYTGESGGLQSDKYRSSALCIYRKRLTKELIAAEANNALLGTVPANCTYRSQGTTTNFPTDLIEQAGEANASQDTKLIRTLTVLLKKFNRSGTANNFVNDLVECSPYDRRITRSVARDPTNRVSCPGLNDFCETAEEILHFPYTRTVNMTRYNDNMSSPSCATGGREIVWKVVPPVAAAGRSFIVQTKGSNYDTLLSVRKGSCGALSQVACNDDVDFTSQSRLIFTADGTNTYYIVAEGKNGAYGKLKVTVTSY